jgi:hypothetical protein
MTKQERIQVPLEPELRKSIEPKARSLGFDSAQAYLRVVIKAEVQGRKLYFDEPILEEASRMAVQVITAQFHEHLLAVLNDDLPRFRTMDQALEYISCRFRRQQGIVAIASWGLETTD